MSSAAKRRWVYLSLLALFVAIVLGVVLFIAGIIYSISTTIPNAYAVWWVSGMVIEHMKSHDDAWPKNWEDLREPYETLTKISGTPWTFDDLQSRVDIDWNADPLVLAKASSNGESPPFKVIWLRNGTGVHWSRAEPNQLILEYLQGKQSDPPLRKGFGAP